MSGLLRVGTLDIGDLKGNKNEEVVGSSHADTIIKTFEVWYIKNYAPLDSNSGGAVLF